MIDSLRHVQVVGALARLAGNGGWARIVAGHPLEEETDRADAELLVAADVLRLRQDGALEPLDFHPWYDDPAVLASGLVAQLRRALQHGEGLPLDAVDPDEIAAMGSASQSVAAILADGILPMLPTTRDGLTGGSGRFLDVGVGTGAISQTLCESYDGLTAVGLDLAPEALAMAEARLAGSTVHGRVELRRMSIIELKDRNAFDLAWMPQIFLTPADLQLGLARVREALKPGCWLVMPVAASDPEGTALERAALEHDAVMRGGGPMSVVAARAMVARAGFVETRDMLGVQQSLVMARKPV